MVPYLHWNILYRPYLQIYHNYCQPKLINNKITESVLYFQLFCLFEGVEFIKVAYPVYVSSISCICNWVKVYVLKLDNVQRNKLCR